jgi:predicted ATPase
LSLLVDQVPAASIFTLFTSRPDFSPPWASRAHLSQITLSHLTRKQVEIMIEKLAGGEALSANVTHQIVTKTDGVPLFVEELTKTVLESRNLKQEDGNYVLTGLLPSLAIPSTLQDSLMARLDRLATGKEVAQLGATIGREFTYELLQAVSPLDEATLQGELTRLVEAELLYQRGIPPRARYFFKHALIQDAAYQSLLKSKRQRYHQKIAEVLEERFPETEEIQPELLAHHYTEAGLRNRAIVYWQMAGHRAIKRSANVEGASHLTKGLKLLETLPGSPERTQLELDLQTALGPALTAIKGWGSSEVEKVYNRARELCQQVGETPQLFWVLWGLWAFYATRGESQTTRELAEQLLSLAQNQQDSALLLEAHTVLGNSLFWLGELASARAHMEQGIALYEFRKHRSHAFIHGHEPGVFCLFSVARVLWYLGYPDQALKRSDEAITLAQEMSHPFSLAWALYFATALHQCRRERQATHERAEAAIALCTEQGFAQWLAGGTILRGWALAELGQRENGIAQMRQGLVAWRATGSERARPYFLSLLAETYGMVGQAEEGLAVLDEVLNTAHKNGDRYYEAELYRLKGELLLGLSQENHKDVETCFRRAIDVARSQNGKSLELRAVVSLSRLWQKQGKKEEARQMLSEIYDWFTEGFNTRDLKEAKALLEDLQ